MRVILDNYMRVYRAKEDTLEELRELLTFKNPKYGFAVAQKKRGKFYAEMPPKYIKCYRDENDHLCIPIGFGLSKLKKVARQYKELVQVVDERSEGHGIDFKVPRVGRFRGFDPHQQKIIDNALQNPNSCASCPTGGGKTLAALGIIETLKMNAIVLVDSADLFEQWTEELEDMAAGKFTVGAFGCGKKKWGDVTIATVQTLRRLNKEKQDEIKDKFGIVIIDEVHKASAPTFVTGTTMFSAKYKIGLSATPYRKDRMDFVFKAYIGEITLDITDKEVEDSGRITGMHFEFVDTNYELDFGTIENEVERYPIEALSDFDRTLFVCQCVVADIEMGFVPIVVSNRVPHLRHLAALLEEQFHLKVGLIHGKVDRNTRKLIRKKMKDGELDVIVANVQIFGTGINIPNLSSAHVPFYTNNRVTLKQISGRVRRGFGDKTYGKIVYYRDRVFTVETDKRTRQQIKKQSETFRKTYRMVQGMFQKWGFIEETENVITL